VTILCPPDVTTSYIGVGCATRGINTEDFGAEATLESTGASSSNNGASGLGSVADGLIIPVAVVLAGVIGGLAVLM